MSKHMGLIGLAIVFLGLNGCASMSGEECLASDWSAIGYEDGSRGYTTDRHANYRKACAKHGVTPDFSAYQSGREQGLIEYCQPGRGFQVGVNGGSYQGVCSVNLEPDFLDAYNAGHHLYALRSSVNRANSSIHSNENEIDRIDKRLAANTAALISDETTQEDRIMLLADMKEIAERRGRLEAEILELIDVRAQAQAELDHYELIVADLGY